MKYISMLILFLLVGGGCAHIQDRHTVKRGETLERISHRYQIGKSRLSALNKNKPSAMEDLSRFFPSQSRQTQLNLAPPRGPLKARFSYQVERATYIRPLPFLWPVSGRVTSPFGYRWGKHHNGIDISARKGTPIKSVRAGRVIHSQKVSGYGNLVIIYHGSGVSSVYAHASKRLVKKGMTVKAGQKIALVGSSGKSTGPHLHFEIRKYKEPKNPLHYLP